MNIFSQNDNLFLSISLMGKYKARVVIEVTIDLEKLYFPRDEEGKLIWSPEFCIEDYIRHALFEGSEYTPEAIEFEDWEVKLSPALKKRLAEISE